MSISDLGQILKSIVHSKLFVLISQHLFHKNGTILKRRVILSITPHGDLQGYFRKKFCHGNFIKNEIYINKFESKKRY